MSILSNNKEKDLKYWVALSTFNKFGPIRFARLLKYFPDMKTAWQAGVNELALAGIDRKTAEEFSAHRRTTDPDEEMKTVERENIKIITINSGDYPKMLKEIYGPPPLLYYKGALPDSFNFCLAVVGSRKYTAYGEQTVRYFTAPLARAGLVIVSGLALGIDALAHQACLEAGGATIAVLGSGVDRQSVYPASNRYLAEKIIARSGLILSEHPCGTPALKHHFPQRNRIISGLSLGALVIEAGIKSGALITAQYALEQNREVFAAPGSIFSPNCEGSNKLIKAGAMAVSSAEEILEALSLKDVRRFVKSQKSIPKTAAEEKIISFLTREPAHIDSLARASRLDTAVVNATLLTMELKGMVRSVGGGNYILS